MPLVLPRPPPFRAPQTTAKRAPASLKTLHFRLQPTNMTPSLSPLSKCNRKPTASASLRTPAAPPRTCARTFVFKSLRGLHARPAALLIKTLGRFDCAVMAQHNGEQVNARSILGLLFLAVGPGSSITFTAQGPDAAAALVAIARLFERRFEDAYCSTPAVESRGRVPAHACNP